MTSQGLALVLDDVDVDFAGSAFRTSIMAVPVSETCTVGAIGADILHHCTLAIGEKSLWASCEGTATPRSSR